MKKNLDVEKALEMLGNSPLKLTSQRINLIKTLFQDGNQHFSAEETLTILRIPCVVNWFKQL